MANELGIANIRMEDRLISLTGPHGILGRAVVVHAYEDDLGRGGYPDSLTTGHAGDRVACGTIRIKYVYTSYIIYSYELLWFSSYTQHALSLAWLSVDEVRKTQHLASVMLPHMCVGI